ncbi:hypothetical protein AA11826_2070 [Komagataeibacter oboediens DSM 11826]|uniref:Uncharacterized protein n=1 Tax=Komagataeibacter oboediens TaxID=65958 RepID=A0A318QGS9_9PROT|nr:hypothetical protein [Komagataeibacter oboediens]PYD78275.1 hypothetical protein CFR80_16700 [Komagataeibacter oboediens]GBR40380.1 hypothetical protein AA11826_2070 [Komagataeibacter oboediens DSM 11826]GCE79009.1 hypothetical protein MSKU3_0484 [Komagataeibacter oboediens]
MTLGLWSDGDVSKVKKPIIDLDDILTVADPFVSYAEKEADLAMVMRLPELYMTSLYNHLIKHVIIIHYEFLAQRAMRFCEFSN